MHDHFRRFAAYNAWANARLYDAATALKDTERKKDVKAYFRSLHGTLNHLLVADRIWLYRLTGEGEAPTRLDAVLYENFGELRTAREAEDQRLIAYVAGLDPANFATVISYGNTRGEAKELPLGVILAHLFNHQTHHRGQASHILRQLGVTEPPSLDLLYFALPAA
ncbi:DinB family protein [Glycocaulis alkaliphilus]|uniref:DinB family protein n=1 Tax=Glycocaulis alkaliphilus TaxID=1434191 RepID=A0A3T0EDC0_9PROT|nr:DinB family protein [Glycocaulis alkaliphilus]AZU05288.1 DinB family protein [Glycocaulis alkaliphilus]GGB81840.1 damage-inducible protein DinB [Glycocaulis alkaliphilus]